MAGGASCKRAQRQRDPGPRGDDLGVAHERRHPLEPQRYPLAGGGAFERGRLVEAAKQHRLVAPRAARAGMGARPREQRARLAVRSDADVERQGAAGPAHCARANVGAPCRVAGPAAAAAPARRERRGGGERLGARAERLVEHQHACSVPGGVAAEQPRRRAAEAVDRLVVVAHEDHVIAAGRQVLEERELDRVQVLRLVDQPGAPPTARACREGRVGVDSRPGLDQELVVVEPAARGAHAFEVLQEEPVGRVVGIGRRWARLDARRRGQRARGQAGELQTSQRPTAVRRERGQVDVAPGGGEVGVVDACFPTRDARDGRDDVLGRGTARWAHPCSRRGRVRAPREQQVGERVEGARLDRGGGRVGVELGAHGRDRRPREADHERGRRIAATGGRPVPDARHHGRGLAGAGHRQHDRAPAVVRDDRPLRRGQGGWGVGGRGRGRRRPRRRRGDVPAGDGARRVAHLADRARAPAHPSVAAHPERDAGSRAVAPDVARVVGSIDVFVAREPLERTPRPRQRALDGRGDDATGAAPRARRSSDGARRARDAAQGHRRFAAQEQRPHVERGGVGLRRRLDLDDPWSSGVPPAVRRSIDHARGWRGAAPRVAAGGIGAQACPAASRGGEALEALLVGFAARRYPRPPAGRSGRHPGVALHDGGRPGRA